MVWGSRFFRHDRGEQGAYCRLHPRRSSTSSRRTVQERLNKLADEVGRRLEIQTIEHRPSLGKLDAASAALEPQARDSLFSTAITKPAPARVSPIPSPSELPHPLSAAAMRLPAYPSPTLGSIPSVQNPWADVPTSRRDVDIQRAAMMMERPQFVIDDHGDGDEEEDYGAEGARDDALLMEVDTFLQGAEGESAPVDKSTALEGQGTFLPLLTVPSRFDVQVDS